MEIKTLERIKTDNVKQKTQENSKKLEIIEYVCDIKTSRKILKTNIKEVNEATKEAFGIETININKQCTTKTPWFTRDNKQKCEVKMKALPK